MDRAAKEAEIASLNECFNSNQIALCADYRGLTVDQLNGLRGELREVGASSRVVKNTLAKISAKDSLKDSDSAQLEKFLELFSGPSFIVFANDDVVSPAKIFAKYGKDLEPFEIKGGWFEGSCLDGEGVKQISQMPSREELYAKLLSIMNAPATQLVRLLQTPGQQVAQVVEAHRANLEKAS